MVVEFGRNEIRQALEERTPVVALESAVLTHGLPRPTNRDTVLRMEAAVREHGAVPAVVGVIEGRLVIGLRPDQIAYLADHRDVEKASARDLAPLMAAGASAGTTVAATLAACRLSGIRVFATGGIGGVHRGWVETMDVSADLEEMAATPCCVVSSGAKAILDLPATLERLESLGVPVVGYQTNAFPMFYSRGSDELLPISHRVDTPVQAAEVCRLNWDVLKQPVGVLLCNPVDPDCALPYDEVEQLVKQAVAAAEDEGVSGQDVTPYLLDVLNRMSDDSRALKANLALLESNAALAAQVAIELAEG
ncbi:MAG: pseudouridine-5'-phosphate glycosidase [Planctomycetes bacterium]|nr:pseudouridine-5'-phosphate glycosidase [Planctomycetota bacterium]NOG55700.1 pseudouridine-5'-phosphate glycosidase [Planctomycetota bacterium]